MDEDACEAMYRMEPRCELGCKQAYLQYQAW